jgi:hypothetical protein
VPPVIDAAEFEAVQALLKTRSPALTAPRIVSGPTSRAFASAPVVEWQ